MRILRKEYQWNEIVLQLLTKPLSLKTIGPEVTMTWTERTVVLMVD